jgi:putative uncharacterized protein (fragment)
VFIIIFFFLFLSLAKTEWSCKDLDFCDDKTGFEAIRWLHQQLDDDENGNVDISESDEVSVCILCLFMLDSWRKRKEFVV